MQFYRTILRAVDNQAELPTPKAAGCGFNVAQCCVIASAIIEAAVHKIFVRVAHLIHAARLFSQGAAANPYIHINSSA